MKTDKVRFVRLVGVGVVGKKIKRTTINHPRSCSTERYVWAANIARVAMGKTKQWGDSPHDKANDDPLAWWCLTEIIATGGPR